MGKHKIRKQNKGKRNKSKGNGQNHVAETIPNNPAGEIVCNDNRIAEELKPLEEKIATVPDDENKSSVASNEKEEANIAIAMMEEQLHSNTKLFQSLNKDIETQTAIIDSKDNAIVSMKIHEERLKSAFNAISEQNTILQKELCEIKLKNGTLDEKLHNMKQQNLCLSEIFQQCKKRIETAERENELLKSKLVKANEKEREHDDERLRLENEIIFLKGENTRQSKHICDLRLERLKSKEHAKKNSQQLLLIKENEKAAFEANTITIAKLMAEQAVKISLLQLQEEKKMCQKENQISNLSKEIDIKQNENEANQKQHLELEEKIKSLTEKFHSAGSSVKELVEDLIEDIDKKSTTCLYQPRIKRVRVTSRLRLMLDKMNREFSDLA